MTTTFAPGMPSWLDLGTTDVPAASAFYGALFGWTVQDLGPDAGGYGMLLKDGLMVGGIGPATDPARGTSWSVYFDVADIEATTARVEGQGGAVVAAPMDVMGQGRMAVFRDPTGAYFSAWQPAAHRGAELVAAPGAMSWVELYSTDTATAKAFYPAVLGVSTRDVEIGPDMTYTLLEVGGRGVAGLMPAPDPASRWSCYFEVEDCDAVADRALELGGVEVIRDDSPAGRLAFLVDPQGGAFSIIRSNPDFSM